MLSRIKAAFAHRMEVSTLGYSGMLVILLASVAQDFMNFRDDRQFHDCIDAKSEVCELRGRTWSMDYRANGYSMVSTKGSLHD